MAQSSTEAIVAMQLTLRNRKICIRIMRLAHGSG